MGLSHHTKVPLRTLGNTIRKDQLVLRISIILNRAEIVKVYLSVL